MRRGDPTGHLGTGAQANLAKTDYPASTGRLRRLAGMPTRRLVALLAVVPSALAVAIALPAPAVVAQVTVPTVSREVAADVTRTATVALPVVASHVAVHWRGAPDAVVTVAFSSDGVRYGRPQDTGRDEAGEARGDGRTYGAVLVTGASARFATVASDRPLGRVSLLAMRDGERVIRTTKVRRTATAAVAAPDVVGRSAWGADESLRYRDGVETWPAAFYPVQKLVVHHTDTTNADPDPSATVRAIYRYHAVTQGGGDIGYNFLVDESGRVYEGRRARQYAAGEQITGEDARGYGVTGAHTSGYNSGTVGIALLGTLTSRDAAPAARDALERTLAWKADGHGLDPRASSVYTNPVNGAQRSAPTISGHRDWVATECPGGTFYATLPALRDAVAARVAAATVTSPSASPSVAPTPTAAPDTTPPPAPTGVTATGGTKMIRVAWSASSDPSGVRGYDVYRAAPKGTFALLATTTTTSHADPVPKGKSYRYYVVAVDGAGNRSAPSVTVSATAR